jgi:hypothetical protein
METVFASPLRVRSWSASSVEAVGALVTDNDGWRIRYRVKGATPTCVPDPFVAIAILPAMRLACPIVADHAVSRQLLQATRRIQDQYRRWHRRLPVVPISAVPIRRVPLAAGSAALFTAGVDSFYTALSHIGEIDVAVFIHGADIALDRRALLRRSADQARSAARALGVDLVEVWTDVKAFARRFGPWSQHAGAAFASVGLLLADRIRRIYIPASLSTRDHYPMGSHPDLDPLFSTEAVEVVHDGFDRSRHDKIAALVENTVAMRWLRVCNSREDGGENCGRCEKCVRTMASLATLGALGRCATLPSELDLAQIRKLRVRWTRGTWEELHRVAVTACRHSIAAAIEEMLASSGTAPADGVWARH